jgi:hypothetical protein
LAMFLLSRKTQLGINKKGLPEEKKFLRKFCMIIETS